MKEILTVAGLILGAMVVIVVTIPIFVMYQASMLFVLFMGYVASR